MTAAKVSSYKFLKQLHCLIVTIDVYIKRVYGVSSGHIVYMYTSFE